MTDNQPDLVIAFPEVPCNQCVENPRAANEDAVICWCEHNHYGAVYVVALGLWNVTGPHAEEADFMRMIHNQYAPFARRRPEAMAH